MLLLTALRKNSASKQILSSVFFKDTNLLKNFLNYDQLESPLSLT